MKEIRFKQRDGIIAFLICVYCVMPAEMIDIEEFALILKKSFKKINKFSTISITVPQSTDHFPKGQII